MNTLNRSIVAGGVRFRSYILEPRPFCGLCSELTW